MDNEVSSQTHPPKNPEPTAHGTSETSAEGQQMQKGVVSQNPLGTGPSAKLEDRIEEKKLVLERYKAQLDFWKFVLGSVIAGIAIATIPPTFQYATAHLEVAKRNAERQKEEQDFRNTYVKDFLSKALDQDIENRIRLAQYFAKVTTDSFKAGWEDYLRLLTDRHKEIFAEIDRTNGELYEKSQDRAKNAKEIEEIQRKLQRMYHEIGVGDATTALLDY